MKTSNLIAILLVGMLTGCATAPAPQPHPAATAPTADVAPINKTLESVDIGMIALDVSAEGAYKRVVSVETLLERIQRNVEALLLLEDSLTPE